MSFVSRLASKQLHRWLPSYVAQRLSAAVAARKRRAPLHVLFAVCDHWEPLFGGALDARGDARVATWIENYPILASGFSDSEGRPPRHTFFVPGEQLRDRWLESLRRLGASGFGEVELHLHHDGDDAASLRTDLARYVADLARHGHLGRVDGRPQFAFIHGNWCLANARPDGRYCGVDDELAVLAEAGCYADLTFPAADNPSQPRFVNALRWPTGDLRGRRAYERSTPARVGERPRDRPLIVLGPTSIDVRRRPWKLAIEAGALTAHDPGTRARVRRWVDLGICVVGRPEWVFVKVHTHGAPEGEAAALLGPAGRRMHAELADRCRALGARLHYVTARELYNVACAAMDGHAGDPGRYRDYVVPAPPLTPARSRE
jgi:hypothetical protein